MSNSADDVSRILAENERLLASPSTYPMSVLNGQYHDEIDYQPVHHRPSIGSDRDEDQASQINHNTASNSVFRRQKGEKIPGTRILCDLYQWVQGPRPPRLFKIKPLLPQAAPLNLLEKFCPGQRQKFGLLIVFYLLWLVVFIVVLSTSVSGCQVPGYRTPVRLSCVSRFW